MLIDDYFVLLASAFVLAYAITMQIYAHKMYYTIAVAAGLQIPGLDDASVAESYFKACAALLLMFYSALWAVKLSFLLFFRRLGQNIVGQRRVWWPVFILKVLLYIACIGAIQYPCLVNSVFYMATNCATPAARTLSQVYLKLNCA